MIVFVTGASGFIGRALLNELLRNLGTEDVIRVLVRRPLPCVDARVHPIHGDLRQANEWLPSMRDADFVFHLGGDASFGDGPQYESVNVEPVRQMLQAVKGSASVQRFVFVSSIGAVDRHRGDRLQSPLTPLTIPSPSSDYGRSKLAAEQLVRDSGVPYTIIRPGWVYGSGMRAKSHLKALAAAVTRSPWLSALAFPGRVPLIHVQDLAKALVKCVGTQESANTTYMAVAENRSLGEIVMLIDNKLHGRKRWQMKLPLTRRIVSRLHAWLPFKINVLFSDYLKVEDAGFRHKLLPAPPILIEQGCVDILSDSCSGQGWWVVTGANSGIGQAITEALTKRSRPVVAVDRCVDNLRESGLLRIVRADLSNDSDLERLSTLLGTVQIAGLINNAGVGFKSLFVDAQREKIETTIAVNVLAPLRLTHRLLPQLRGSQAVIVNIASSVAYHPLPGMATYAATKALLASWSLALGDELRATNHVVTFSPSGTRTAFQIAGGVKGEGAAGLLDPQEVASAVLRAVDRRQRHCLMGWKSRLLVTGSYFLPIIPRLALWRTLFARMR